jgi:hypothetical protein
VGRWPGTARGAVSTVPIDLQPEIELVDGRAPRRRTETVRNAGVGAGLGPRPPGRGPGLVPSPKFETPVQIRALRASVGRSSFDLAGSSPAGGAEGAAQLLDRESSHRITDRSRPGGSVACVPGSSAEGTSPVAPKARAPGPCGWGCRASTTTVTRNWNALPSPPRRISRPERAIGSVGAASS